MQIPTSRSEDSGADAEVRVRMVPAQRLGQVPEGCGAHTQIRFW